MRKIITVIGAAMVLFAPLLAAATRATHFPGGLVVGTPAAESNATTTIGQNNLYVAGAAEVDGAIRLDGAITATSSLVLTGNMTAAAKVIRTPLTQTGLTISSAVVITSDFMVITSSGGNITSTATVFISTATATNPNGTHVILMGGNTDSITIPDAAVFALGAATRALSLGDILELVIYDGVWYEIGFTNN